MSIEYPKSPDTKFKEYVDRKKAQEANLRALRESVANQKKTTSNMAVLEAQDIETDQRMRKQIALENMKDPVRKNQIKRAAMEAMTRVKPDGIRMLTNKVLFELVYESLWVDDNVKEQEVRPMFECFNDTVKFLKTSCPRAFEVPKNKLTFAMEAAIKETVDEVYGRINAVFEDAMKSGDYNETILDKLRFNLIPEEEEKLDEKLTNLGQNQIVSLVKKKVLSVVQDEKKRAGKRAEMFDELDEAAKDEEETDDDMSTDTSEEDSSDNDEGADCQDGSDTDSVEEDDNTEVGESYSPVEEVMKTKSFWGKLQKKLKRRKDGKKMESDEDIEDDEDPIEESYAAFEALIAKRKVQAINRVGATSVFEGLTMFNRQVAQREILCSDAPITEATFPEMVASASMMQSLMQYTTMETLNTIQYCNITRGDMNGIRMILNRASSKLVNANDDVDLSLTAQL